MNKKDVVDILYTVVCALACPFALLIQPPPFVEMEGEDHADT